MMRGLVDTLHRGCDRRPGARDRARPARASTSAVAPTSWPATRRRHAAPAPGQHPAPAADPGPPADPARVRGAGAGGVPACRAVAAGIGFSLALAADFTIAAADARASGSRSRERGFTADSGATWLLPRRVGEVRARELLLLGRELSGADAAAWGAIHAAVPAGELDGAVDELVERLASGPTVTLGLMKWLLHAGRDVPLDQHLRNEAFALELSSRTEDFREGLSAFREKRDPKFDGQVSVTTRLAIDAGTNEADAVAAVRAWVEVNVPRPWVDAGRAGGSAAVREVRTRAEYEAWYPVFAASGLVAPTWPVDYGGLDLSVAVARDGRAASSRRSTSAASTRSASTSPRPRSSRTAPRSSGCASSRRSCATRRCGASCSASPARAPTSRRSRHARCATATAGSSTGRRCGRRGRTAPTSACCSRAPIPTSPSAPGITYFLIDLHQPGVEVRPLRHIGGDVDFNEVFLEDAVVPDAQRVGDVGDGWKVANATLSGERQMVSGAGSGGVDRIGGLGVDHVLELARRSRPQRRAGGAAGADAPPHRGAHPRLDQPAGACAGEGGPLARTGELDRQGAPGRSQPAGAAAGDGAARRGTRWPWERRNDAAARCAGCCAAAPTRSRAARPRSTRTSSASGCSACRASPIRGARRPGGTPR